MIRVLIEIPHRSELISAIFSALLSSNSIISADIDVVVVGSGTVVTSTAASVTTSGINGVASVVVVVVVVVGVYLGDGGKTTSFMIFGGSGSNEFGKSNSTEKLGGQFLCDCGSSKWAKKNLFFLLP